MSGNNDIVLRFVYQTPADLRSFRVYQVIRPTGELELYRFHHPTTGMSTGITTYHRKNLLSLVFETAGRIEWTSNTNGVVFFGVDEVSIKDLRKVKNPTSRSRRFKANGIEYKWKVSENGTDFYCVDTKDNPIANWSQEETILRVTPSQETLLDRLIVTCFLHLWYRQLGKW